jgi:hypothetical protein
MFKSIDTKINNNNITDETIYISKRFCKIIKYFVKRNKEWMDLSIMKTINTYFKNIIKSNSYIFFNPNNLVVNYVNHKNVIKVK